MHSCLIFLDSSDIGATYTARASLNLGYEPIFISHMRNYAGDTRAQLAQHRCYDTDTTSISAILETIKKIPMPIKGITTFLDSKMQTSIEISKQLNIAGIDDAILLLADKGNVYKLLPEYCPPSIIFSSINIPFDVLSTLLKQYGGVFIKPTNASGGLGCLSISTPQELADLTRQLQKVAAQQNIKTAKWIAQPLLNGLLFSFEGYIENGVLYPLGISQRKKLGNTESYNVFPADAAINKELQTFAAQTLTQLFTKAHFRNGYFHSEFILQDEKLYLIDVNAGRLGGATIGQQIALSYQIDPVAIFEHVIALSLFKCAVHPPYRYRLNQETIGVCYGINKKSTLKSVHLPTNNTCMHTKILSENCLVEKMGVNNWSWIGLIAGFKNEVQRELQEIKIETIDEIVMPVF